MPLSKGLLLTVCHELGRLIGLIAAHGLIPSTAEIDAPNHTRLGPARSQRRKGGFGSPGGSVSKVDAVYIGEEVLSLSLKGLLV